MNSQLNKILFNIVKALGGAERLRRVRAVRAVGEVALLVPGTLRISGRFETVFTNKNQYREFLDYVGDKDSLKVYDASADKAWLLTTDNVVTPMTNDARISVLQTLQLLSLSWLSPDCLPAVSYKGTHGSHHKLLLMLENKPSALIYIRSSDWLPDQIRWLSPSRRVNPGSCVASIRLCGRMGGYASLAKIPLSSTVTTEISQWQRVDGIRYPAVIRERLGPGQQQVFTVKKVELNPRLKPTVFAMPVKRKPESRFRRRDKTAVVPFRFIETKILIDLFVNGHGPLVFVFDTGSSQTILDESLASKLKLHTQFLTKGLFGAGQDEIVINSAEAVTFDLGDVEIKIEEILTTDIRVIAEKIAGVHTDGFLGGTFIKNFVVDIDYGQRFLTLSQNPANARRDSRYQLPLDLSKGTPIIAAGGKVGRTKLEDKMMVDTGSDWDVIFTRPFAEKEQLHQKLRPSIETAVFGINGKAPVLVGRLTEASIGRLRIQEPLVAVSKTNDGSMGSTDFDGIIGADFLQRFDVRFDYANSSMHLIPNRREMHRPIFDMLGCVVFEKPPYFQKFEIQFVIKGSPGHKAGLRRKDVIESINGATAAAWTLPELRNLCRTAERKCQFVLRRGKKRFEREIVMTPII